MRFNCVNDVVSWCKSLSFIDWVGLRRSCGDVYVFDLFLLFVYIFSIFSYFCVVLKFDVCLFVSVWMVVVFSVVK